MSTAPPPPSADLTTDATAAPPRARLRSGRLGAIAITFFVVAAVAPMAAIVGASPVVFSANGVTAPLIYFLAALLFALFSVGYVAMSRHITNAGGFVAYIARGLGVRAATAAAGMAILAYTALQAALWSQFSVFAHQLLIDRVGIHIPRWILLFGALALVTALTVIGVDVSLKVLGALVALEIAAFVILDAAIIFGGGGPDGNSLAAFNPTDLGGPGLGVAFLFGITCFTGFEATVVFSEEAKEPRRTIPRAVYGSIAFIGIALAIILAVFEVAGADPVAVTFSWLLSLGTVTLIVILVLTSISVVAFFARTHAETSRWRTVVAPVLSTVGFGLVIYLALTNYGALLGGQGGTAQWLLLLIPVVAIAGFCWPTVRRDINYQAELV